jgi:hypothetical protein
MLALFEDFDLGNLDIKRINFGIITLLPRVKDAERIQQFRPICLLNYCNTPCYENPKENH